MRTVSLLGSTGSVGTQALDVIRKEPEHFHVRTLAAQRSVEELLAQAAAFGPELVVIGDPARYGEVHDSVPAGTEVMVGEEGMVAAAGSADVVLNTVVGFAGLPVTMAALEAGKRLALANKESLITAPGRAEGPSHPGGGDRPGGFRALRRAPMPGCRAGDDRRGPAPAHHVGRPVPRLDGRAAGARSPWPMRWPTRRGRWGPRSPSTRPPS